MLANVLRSKRRRVLAAVLGCVSVLALAGYAARGQTPAAMAYGADVLRGIIGDQAVAQLENLVYRTQDKLNQSAYTLGADQPAAPWATTAPNVAAAVTPTEPLAPDPATATPPAGHGGSLASSGPVSSPTSPAPTSAGRGSQR